MAATAATAKTKDGQKQIETASPACCLLFTVCCVAECLIIEAELNCQLRRRKLMLAGFQRVGVPCRLTF